MKKQNKRELWISLGSLTAFVLWTILVSYVDVQPIGPNGSSVGFATLNRAFHKWTGVHWALYTITDWLGLIPIGIAFGFAVLGFVQLVRRRSLFKVDCSILVLGVFYIVVLAVYLLFEKVALNVRPVMIEGNLEASYPSSTTMLALCVLPTAMMQFKDRIRKTCVQRVILSALAVFTGVMVIGRLISGVHWLSDILGGVLLSTGLVAGYTFAVRQTLKNVSDKRDFKLDKRTSVR